MLNIDINLLPVPEPKPQIRAINGIVNGPKLFAVRRQEPVGRQDSWALFRELKISCIRTHDLPLFDEGGDIQDVSRVFPLFDADADDPGNYFFAESDTVMAKLFEITPNVEYRLGESIDHRRDGRRVKPPRDVEHWVDICSHIIRHYNEGWANGFHFGIKHWCIWEEANSVPQLWNSGSFSTFLPFYGEAAQKLKARFPDLLFGTELSMGGKQGNPDKIIMLLEYCRDHRCPIDFLHFSSYRREPDLLGPNVRTLRRLLDEYGFSGTKLTPGEWHYSPADWSLSWSDMSEVCGINSGAYTAHGLINLQDIREADMAFFYSAQSDTWGLFKLDDSPQAAYWAFRYFADLLDAECRQPLEIKNADRDVVALAGRMPDGSIRVLLSCFKAAAGWIRLNFGTGYELAELRICDEDRMNYDGKAYVTTQNPGEFNLWRLQAGSAIYAFTFIPKK